MNNILSLIKKDLRLYFSSFIAYVLIAVFLVMSGYFFSSMVNFFSLMSVQVTQQPMYEGGLNLTEMIVAPLFLNISMVMVFMLPIMTMRSFSEEKKEGTIELLYTYPISDLEIVMAKFFSVCIVFMIMLLPVAGYPFLIKLVGGVIELSTYYVALLGLFFMGISFITLGVFVSSLTKNQVVAVSVSFASLLGFFMLGWSRNFVSPNLAEFLKNISIIEHFRNFAQGLIDTQDILFYVLFSFFFIFFTLRVVESRNWRG